MLYTNIRDSLILLFAIIVISTCIVGTINEIKGTAYNMNYECDGYSQEQHLAPSNCF